MEKEEVLTAQQKKAIAFIAAEQNLSGFYLSGGTALSAFYLKHRLSDDLDFFIDTSVDHQSIHAFMEYMKKSMNARGMSYEHVYDRNIYFLKFLKGKELKIEFTKYPFKHLGKVIKRSGLQVDSLRDLAANKLMALLDRFDPKDFVDMYFLLQQFSLSAIRHDAEKKFGARIGDMLLGSELAKVRRITALPVMLRNLTIDELKSFFAQKAQEVGKSLLLS